MRRSAAPSQLGSANKRPRFAPPFAVKTPNQTPSPQGTSFVNQEANRTKRDVLNLIHNNSKKGELNSEPTKLSSADNLTNQNSFRTPYSNKTQNAQSENTNREGVLQDYSSEGAIHEHNYQECSNSAGRTILQSEITESVSIGDKTEQTFEDEKAHLSKNIPFVRKKAGLHRSSFRQPMLQKGASENSPVINSRPDISEDDAVKSRYFNVVWCKLSKKKHKKWEGDAVLITKTRSVTLLDMEGKEIGKGRGYKIKDLETLSEGQTLVVGGKEIEVMGEIPEVEFTSGQCFQASAVSTSAPVSVTSVSHPSSSKPFMNPLKGGQQSREKTFSERPQAKPLFDPTVSDALVMPRPNATHQWDNNTAMQTIVDVVIDPYLASKLRPHQREGVRFLYECVMGMRAFHGNGAILADDMGLGKTLQCITVIWTLYKQGPYGGKPQVKRVLVITPGSLVKNWCREFRKWLGNERIRAFDVGSDKKVEEFAKSPIYPVMVISYEMLVRSIDDIQKIKFDLVICDEGHRLKNTNIKTTSLIMSLPCRKRILLTGTPVQNDLQEFFSIVEFCNPGVLGSSGAFHRVYEDPILKSRQPGATQEDKTLGETRATELSRLTSLFVLRRTQEINNRYLPPKVETVVFCQPSELQLALYRKLLASRVIRRCLTNSYRKEASPHLVCIAALKKLCNHPCLIHKECVDAEEESEGNRTEEEMEKKRWRDAYDDEEVSLYTGLLPLYPSDFSQDSLSIDHSGKLQVLSNLLQGLHEGDVKEKIVLVSNYTQTLDVLQTLCERDGYEFCRLDGSTPTSKRQNIVEQFNSKYSQQTVFLLSSKAGGVGLNLIGASRLVLYDIDWNPANDLQAMARVWRDGQKKTVYIYRLISAGTLEEKVYQRQISKQGLSGAVMDAKIQSQSNVKFSLEELKDLFTLHEGAKCITHDMLDCDCDRDYTTAQPVTQSAQSVTQSRPCQLGQKPHQKAKKNLSMDELMGWKHFAGPLNEDFKDIHLRRAKDYITYVFHNVTNLTDSKQMSGQTT